jgi:predicted nuclease of predicted toxin-antitoxin system
MRWMADENLERPIIERLRENGHDVATVHPANAGDLDAVLLARSVQERRILVTNDKDFAELTFLQQKASAGIVLVRLPRLRTPDKAERVLEVIEEQGERLAGVFTVIEERSIRRRPFLSVRREEGS